MDLRKARRALPALMLAALAAAASIASCGGDSGTDTGSTFGVDASQSDGTGGLPDGNAADHSLVFGQDANGTSDATGLGSPDAPASFGCDGCTSFPPPGTTGCTPQVLGAPTIAYPTDGLLLPPNMNVLEVQFVPPAGATLFEVDFANALTDVRVETTCIAVPDVRGGASQGCGVTLPQAAWNDIANRNRDGDPVHVTVRATIDGTCVSTSAAKIDLSFAKDDLAGGIYYWQSAVYGGIGGKTGGIYSHDFGTFDPTPTPFYVAGTSDGGVGTCVGCHNVSRDGARMSLATDDPDADDEFGDVKTHVMDIPTRSVVGGMAMSPGFQTFSHDHAKMIASTYKTSKNAAFAVFNGDGTTLLATNTLPNMMAATQPDLSKDDASLVYVVPQALTISMAGDHHFMGGSLYGSTFDNTTNLLGAPTLLLQAPDDPLDGGVGSRSFYYPSFAPSGSFLVFNDAPFGDSFYNTEARVKVVHYPPMAGDTPIDLPALNKANGLSNSWPRWSPFVQTYKGHKLLWVTFSSNRDYGLHLTSNATFPNCYPPESPAYDVPQPLSKKDAGYEGCAQPQIWMAAIVVDDDRSLDTTDRSFPAFWLPFQDVNSHNHSAQWVEQVQGPPGQGDGGGTGQDASQPPMCGEQGASCGSAGGTCCADVVCCGVTCTDTCIK